MEEKSHGMTRNAMAWRETLFACWFFKICIQMLIVFLHPEMQDATWLFLLLASREVATSSMTTFNTFYMPQVDCFFGIQRCKLVAFIFCVVYGGCNVHHNTIVTHHRLIEFFCIRCKKLVVFIFYIIWWHSTCNMLQVECLFFPSEMQSGWLLFLDWGCKLVVYIFCIVRRTMTQHQVFSSRESNIFFSLFNPLQQLPQPH